MRKFGLALIGAAALAGSSAASAAIEFSGTTQGCFSLTSAPCAPVSNTGCFFGLCFFFGLFVLFFFVGGFVGFSKRIRTDKIESTLSTSANEFVRSKLLKEKLITVTPS